MTKHRPLSPPCTPTRRAPRRPTGRRSSAGTTSCTGSPRARSCSSTGPSRSARPRGLGHGGPWPAPPHRRLGVPPREGGRPSDRGTVVCRRRPVRPQPRRTSPPHPAGSADQSSAAWVSLLVNPSHKTNPLREHRRAGGMLPQGCGEITTGANSVFNWLRVVISEGSWRIRWTGYRPRPSTWRCRPQRRLPGSDPGRRLTFGHQGADGGGSAELLRGGDVGNGQIDPARGAGRPRFRADGHARCQESG